MTDIYGHPEPCRLYVPVYLSPPRPTPFPGLSILVTAYTLFACLYVIGAFTGFPRTHWHDAALAIGFCLTCLVWKLWACVERIPYAGRLLYLLPAATLAAAPFVLDVYLMYGR